MFHVIRKIDIKALNLITRLHCAFLDTMMVMATYAGTGAFLWWVTLVAPFLLSDAYRRTGLTMIAALGVNYLLGEIIIKKAVGRIRPSALLPVEEMKVAKPTDHSFPSGHAASSFCAFAVTLFCCSPIWWIPALIVALIIAFSRLYLRVHYPSDVLAGIVLGMGVGTATVVIARSVTA